MFDHDDGKWKDVRSAMLYFLSPTSFKGPDPSRQDETQRTVDQLIKKTQQLGSVNPLSLLRFHSINTILATSFGQPGTRSLRDPLYRCLMNKSDTRLHFSSIWKPWSWMSHLRRFFSRETGPKDALYAPLQRVIQMARKSSIDNVVKRIDLLKEEYLIDEHEVTVIAGKLRYVRCRVKLLTQCIYRWAAFRWHGCSV